MIALAILRQLNQGSRRLPGFANLRDETPLR
jgi:hypothetical protein